ncbi:MAG: hypothetical protein ABSA47_05740 [Verrucomicrobiota bacterium]|jgi:hypothetical protein
MSVNKYLPHVLVLPEDDANRQLANGFQLDPSLATRRMQILEEAGGWQEVLNRFTADHLPEMERYAGRFMVLLIDFDGRDDRLKAVRAAIPDHLGERVFVLGVWTEPEELRQNLGSYETIGLAMAKDCRENTDGTWAHRLLCHNAGELERLREHVRPVLFSDV